MNAPHTAPDSGTTAPLFTESVTDHAGGDRDIAHLILAHGFTQNTRCWGDFPAQLSAHGTSDRATSDHATSDHGVGPCRITLVDLPGHGRSGHDSADLPEAAGLLAAVGPGIFVGYSMGGRVALHAALARPEAVEALVLIGATAGIADPSARAERRQRDSELAADIEAIAAATGSTATFIDRWLATPLFAALTPEQQHRSERITNRAEGLSASLRNCGTGTQKPLHERLASLSMPVLCLAGERDAKFREQSQILVASIGANATAAVVPDAGHACHLEAPEVTAQAVSVWLRETGPR